MGCVAEPRRSLSWYRVAVFATIAVSAVSCSSDSARFDNPFSSKSTPAADVTNSTTPKQKVVHSQPLPPPTNVQAPGTRPAVVTTTTAGGARGIVNYQPPVAGNEVTGTVPGGPAPKAHVSGCWSLLRSTWLIVMRCQPV